MKKIVFLLTALLLSVNINAQIVSPVKWEYRVKKVSGTEYELHALAIIDKPWHLYGQYFDDGGPIKLQINFEESNDYELIGKTLESPKPKVVRDEIFNIDVHYFADKALFIQKVKIKKATEIKVELEGQVCNDNTGMCVMVSGEYTFKLK